VELGQAVCARPLHAQEVSARPQDTHIAMLGTTEYSGFHFVRRQQPVCQEVLDGVPTSMHKATVSRLRRFWHSPVAADARHQLVQ
jgi:hypothetical protein